MSLRRKLKPPKPFTGEVMDDLSSSIQGDRTIESSEMEQPPPSSIRSPKPEPTIEKFPPTKTFKRRAPLTGQSKDPKMPRITKEETGSTSRGMAPSLPSVWRPGLGMTPANNKRYLGPQTEFNPNLPPAAFPTYTSDQYINDQGNGRTPAPDPKPSPPPIVDPTEDDTITDYEMVSPFLQGRHQNTNASTEKPILKTLSQDHAGAQAGEGWDKLSNPCRMVVVDSIASIFGDDERRAIQALMHLPITDVQYEALREALKHRRERDEAEDQIYADFTRTTTKHLMNTSGSVDEVGFRSMLQSLYQDLEENGYPDIPDKKPDDDQNARTFLWLAGYNPDLLDGKILPSSSHLQRPKLGTKRQESGLLRSALTKQPPEPVNTAATASGTVSMPFTSNASSSLAHAGPRINESGGRTPRQPPVYILLGEERRHNERMVAAALHGDPRLQAGTALTGSGGTRGLNAREIEAGDPPAGDMTFEEWRQSMNCRFHGGQRTEEREALEEVQDDDVLGNVGSD